VELADHLFRREASRLVAILTRIFGVENLALAEDVVQDAFCQALETWKFHGPPEDPSAWLMAVAKRRAIDVLRRESTKRRFAPDIGRQIESEWTLAPAVERAFDAGGIEDVELRMMFSCIHPRLSEETQLALVLHLLCGFSMDETAAAFLKNAAATEKRLVRAKRTLAESRELFVLAGSADVASRLPSVLRAIYLLFNEGYHGASQETAVRAELCAEALRLARLLAGHPLTAVPATHALLALMALHAARLPARVDGAGDLILLEDQDRSRWDRALIHEGRRELERAAAGEELTTYHVEAAIAALHAQAACSADTDWSGVIALYDTLRRIEPSPVVALNRAVAIAQRDGPARGLAELAAIEDVGRLEGYPFYFTAAGEFKRRLGRRDEARASFARALALARSPIEKRFLERKISSCAPRTPPLD
jgi:RNA polymerase sigma-70 factor (ECF subfamily)